MEKFKVGDMVTMGVVDIEKVLPDLFVEEVVEIFHDMLVEDKSIKVAVAGGIGRVTEVREYKGAVYLAVDYFESEQAYVYPSHYFRKIS